MLIKRGRFLKIPQSVKRHKRVSQVKKGLSGTHAWERGIIVI